MRNHPTKIKVGSDWSSCPCCGVTYFSRESHHRACPVGMSSSICTYCGGTQAHLPGCPHQTNLYPVLYKETHARLECARCETLFQPGDCFVAGETSILCVGCGWIESGEQIA